MCCSGEDVSSNTVVVIAEPASNEPTPESDKKQAEEEEKKRKADEEAAAAAAAQRQRELENEQRRKREAEEEEARQTKAKEEEEARRRKEETEAAEAAAAKEAAAKEAAAKEAAAAAAAAAKEADGLPLTFRDASGAKTYTVNFKTKPLGMDFNNNTKPVKITKAFGAARKLGVSDGSCLIGVGSTDVEKLGFNEMLVVLKEKIAPLKAEGLTINFKDTSGQLTPIVFPTKPLGMDFDSGKQPIRIKGVNGASKSLGVQVNWVLASIDGTNVESMEFEQMLILLRSKIEVLPTKD